MHGFPRPTLSVPALGAFSLASHTDMLSFIGIDSDWYINSREAQLGAVRKFLFFSNEHCT